MRRACRRDANSGAIFKALRQACVFVLDTQHVGDGWPDALGCYAQGPIVALEIKTLTGQLREKQIAWRDLWRSAGKRYEVVRTIDQALAAFGIGVRVQSESMYSVGGKGRIMSEADEHGNVRQPLTVRRAPKEARPHG